MSGSRKLPICLNKSVNKSRGKKKTQFKKGCRHTERSEQETAVVEINAKLNPVPVHQSVRMTVDEAKDAVQLMTNNQNSLVESVRLRPKPNPIVMVDNKDTEEENLIASVGKLTDIFNQVHRISCKRSKIRVVIEKRVGLCVYVSLKCVCCNFTTPCTPLTDTIKQHRGPEAGTLNRQVVLPILKSKVGIEDTINVLSCMNIRAPSKQLMQRKLNEMGDMVVKLNEDQMALNQQYIERTAIAAGVEAAVDIQFDVAYASRPQGGSEKATQSVGTIIGHSTHKSLPLSISVANKHCALPKCTEHKTRKQDDSNKREKRKCTKTYPTNKSIAASENVLLHRSLDKMKLKVKTITTDACSQTKKALRDYYKGETPPCHNLCFFHRLRTLYKQIKGMKLQTVPKKHNKCLFMNKLAACVRNRVRQELANLKIMGLTQCDLVNRGAVVTSKVVQCFSGDHGQCRDLSTVCKSHLAEFKVTDVPFHEYLELSEADNTALRNKIDKYFGIAGLTEMSNLFNTNMCESLNAAIFYIATKTVQHKRNWDAICHSATHSWTLGSGYSTVLLARANGIVVKTNTPMYRRMWRKDNLRRYYSSRQQTGRYKSGRYFAKKKKSYQKVFNESVFSEENADSVTAGEHSYADYTFNKK